jgi:predicted amidophosphoribosyltransferase
MIYKNVRENRRGNQEWIIQRKLQHWVQKHRTKTDKAQHKLKKRATRTSTKTGVHTSTRKGKQIMPKTRHPPCY